MYDYFKDTFGRSYKDIKDSLRTSTLTRAVAYEAKPLHVRNRTRSDYSENKFEAEASGLCKALKSELADLHRSEERAIRDNLIQKKRDEAEAERLHLIEEELKLEEERERGKKRLAEEIEHQLELEEEEKASEDIEKLQHAGISHHER
jgi:ATP-dependent Lon protease